MRVPEPRGLDARVSLRRLNEWVRASGSGSMQFESNAMCRRTNIRPTGDMSGMGLAHLASEELAA